MIEVYPAATLLAHGIAPPPYKDRAAFDNRRYLVSQLEGLLRLPEWDLAIDNPDVLDALMCVIAGADFLAGGALEPPDPKTAMKEGWIWFRDPDLC